MANIKKLVSIITPVYNEYLAIDDYYKRIVNVISKLSQKYDFEIIFTDNCSNDNTLSKLKNLAKKDNRIKIYSFSKNYGYQKSILFGYLKSKGDVGIELDVDLQDPPELLPEMLSYWNKGYEIVYGIRTNRKEGFVITFLRKIYYRLIRKLSDFDIPNDVGDFILIDRKIIENLTRIFPSDPYLRGAIFSFGFSRIGIKYSRDKRHLGKSKFPLSRLIQLGIDGFVNTSIFPLRISSFLGIFTTFLSVLLAFYYIFDKIFYNNNLPEGTTLIIVLILFSISINSLLIGILGEYIAKIHKFNNDINKIPLVKESID